MPDDEFKKLIATIKNNNQPQPKPNKIQFHHKPTAVQTFDIPTPKNAPNSLFVKKS